MAKKEKPVYRDYDGAMTQKQAKWYDKLDKCPKYIVSKRNVPWKGRIDIVGHPRIQAVGETLYESYYVDKKTGEQKSTLHFIVGAGGYERFAKPGKEVLLDDFKYPAWRPFAFDSYWSDYEQCIKYIVLQSWDEIRDYVSDRDYQGSLYVYKNPEQ